MVRELLTRGLTAKFGALDHKPISQDLGGSFPAIGQHAQGSSVRPSSWNSSWQRTSSSKCYGSWREASAARLKSCRVCGASKQGPALLAPGRALRGLSPLHTPNRINYIFKRCRPAIPGEPGESSIMARPRFTSCRIVLTLVKRIFIFH